MPGHFDTGTSQFIGLISVADSKAYAQLLIQSRMASSESYNKRTSVKRSLS